MPQEAFFRKSIKYIKGVGEARAKLLTKLGIVTVDDAINYFPRDYEDRTVLKRISEIVDGEECGVAASIISDIAESRPRRNLSLIKALATDGTSFLSITWFNQSYLKKSLEKNVEYIFLER